MRAEYKVSDKVGIASKTHAYRIDQIFAIGGSYGSADRRATEERGVADDGIEAALIDEDLWEGEWPVERISGEAAGDSVDIEPAVGLIVDAVPAFCGAFGGYAGQVGSGHEWVLARCMLARGGGQPSAHGEVGELGGLVGSFGCFF